MLVLAIVTAAAILTAVAVLQRGGSDAKIGPTGNVADCANALDAGDSNAFDSNAFNFGDAVACADGRRRAAPK